MNGARVWFKIDSFEIVNVIHGELRATSLHVRHGSPRGPRYPKDLVEGEVYLLRLSRGLETRRQLTEMKGSAGPVWIDGIEITREQQ